MEFSAKRWVFGVAAIPLEAVSWGVGIMEDIEIQIVIDSINRSPNNDPMLRERLLHKRITGLYKDKKISDVQLWDFLSGERGITANVAKKIYEACGFIPFEGFPLKKRGNPTLSREERIKAKLAELQEYKKQPFALIDKIFQLEWEFQEIYNEIFETPFQVIDTDANKK